MAYRTTNAMGISLTPPDWLKRLVGGITGGQATVVNPIQPAPPAPTPTTLTLGTGDMPSWLLPAAALGVVALLLLRKR